jgi:dTMP kinase
MAPAAELFLMLVARADLVDRVIRPALASGGVVVADRFDLSTLAYQVAGAGMAPGVVRVANGLATGGLRPDLTLVLDIPVAVARQRQRRAGKRRDRFERRGDAYHARVLKAYRNAHGRGVVHIDAAQSHEAVRNAAWQHVTRVVLNP